MKNAGSLKLSEESLREIEVLAAMSDDDIDTSDIPEIFDWTGAMRGLLYKPVKQQLTLRVDADVVDWFKRKGTGYQTQMNAALREHIGREMRKKAS